MDQGETKLKLVTALAGEPNKMTSVLLSFICKKITCHPFLPMTKHKHFAVLRLHNRYAFWGKELGFGMLYVLLQIVSQSNKKDEMLMVGVLSL